MSLNLTNLFTAIGRIGREAYIINGAQDIEDVPFTALAGYAYVNPAWLVSLTASYDSLIRQQSTGMSVWQQVAQNILLGFVTADAPAYGISLSTALPYVEQQMIAQSKTFKECTIGETVTADAANVGEPKVVVSLVRADGLTFQNTVAEEGTLIFTADSYTGGATVGREPWSYVGARNNSSLATGVPVGNWDWDYPQGSGVSVQGNNIDASQDASASGNFLTNGDFEDWTGNAPAVLDYWHLRTGTWGTTVQRATGGLDGDYCVEFVAAAQSRLTQEFDSSVSDGTDATAGTTASPSAFTGYTFNVWLKAAGALTNGKIIVSLVDDTYTVIDDQAGTPNTTDISYTDITTSWTAHPVQFRLPVIVPSTIRLHIEASAALDQNVKMDWAAFCKPTSLYTGGPNVCSFSNPAAPVEAGPDPDAFTIVFTNDRGGATYANATFQTLMNTLFPAAQIIYPYASVPSFADTLITGA